MDTQARKNIEPEGRANMAPARRRIAIVLVWSNPETPPVAPKFLARLRLVQSA